MNFVCWDQSAIVHPCRLPCSLGRGERDEVRQLCGCRARSSDGPLPLGSVSVVTSGDGSLYKQMQY